jgi:hypothetical protein
MIESDSSRVPLAGVVRAMLAAALVGAVAGAAADAPSAPPVPAATPAPQWPPASPAAPVAPAPPAARTWDFAAPLHELLADAGEMAGTIVRFGDEAFGFVQRELGTGRVVKGAPYCADAVHETVQPLADGNRIVRTQTSRLCRDGEGRTRQEVTGSAGRTLVYLRDPVARESWVLDPARKTARRAGIGGFAEDAADSVAGSAAWRDYAERMREWAREMAERAREGLGAPGKGGTRGALPTPPAPPAPPAPAAAPVAAAPQPAPVVISRATASDGTTRTHEVEVHVSNVTGADVPAPPPIELPALGPALGWRASGLAPRGPGVVTALPAREIEGLRVNGERTTWTIEAGKVGNDKPIVITREVWTSPELILTVQTRDFDPRSGEVSYRLKNLRRAEPDAALMRVPAEYARAGGSTTPRAPAPPAAPAPPSTGRS